MHSRVALSNIFCLQKLGAKVTVCGPKTLIPRHIKSLGVKVEYDLNKAIVNADVINMLRIQFERQKSSYFPSVNEYIEAYSLTKQRLKLCSKPPLILHPGPMNRGVEIMSDVADSSNAIILEQVENGVAIRMAVLYLLSRNL